MRGSGFARTERRYGAPILRRSVPEADLQWCYPNWGRTDKKATAMNENTDDKWITRQDLADRYGVPVKTPAEWASKGTGPRYAKIGRHVRYLLSDVIDWERK
jgi:predicted DNA-binding transcriptional regulator AlpA